MYTHIGGLRLSGIIYGPAGELACDVLGKPQL